MFMVVVFQLRKVVKAQFVLVLNTTNIGADTGAFTSGYFSC